MNYVQGRGTKNIDLQRLQTIFSPAFLIAYTIMEKNIWNKAKKSCKIGQEQKTLINDSG